MDLYSRPHLATLKSRLSEEPRLLINIAGPRQCGKTTLVRQALDSVDRPGEYLSADEPVVPFSGHPSGRRPSRLSATAADVRLLFEPDILWLVQAWENARKEAQGSDNGFILVLDEIQHVQGNWSRTVKGMWDRDRQEDLPLHVVLLGSAPWLMQKGLSESLMGRFETIRLPHWSFPEMAAAFGFSLDEYVYFGGYPGGAPFIRNEDRWRDYILDGLVMPVLERDVLALDRVKKPALLRQLFAFGCEYSGQILSYTKMVGQLQDAGNTTTLAHYLDLLAQVGLLRGLQKHTGGQAIAQRRSSPKFVVLNTALMSALSEYTFAEAKADRSHWGRLVESAVGAHLCNTASSEMEVYYWREKTSEVDFVVRRGRRRIAVEVKSGSRRRSVSGLDAFVDKFPKVRPLIVGTGGMPLKTFLSTPARNLFQAI